MIQKGQSVSDGMDLWPQLHYPQITHVKAEDEPQWCGFKQYEPHPGFNPQN